MRVDARTSRQLLKERIKRFPALRMAIKPYMSRRLREQDREYASSEDARFISSLKNSHEGERCFIIGNGPSLNEDDLNRLVGEFTFAANGIYHMFESVKWRPSFYMCVDRNALSLTLDEILSLDLDHLFLDVYAKGKVGKQPGNVTYINSHLTHFDARKFTVDNIGFSEDPSHYLCAGYTVLYGAMQMAIYMGFKTIILLGVDHNYARSIDSDGKIQSINSSEDHFFSRGKSHGYYYYEGVEYAYHLARQVAEERGISIINATRGGDLGIFPRISLENCFV